MITGEHGGSICFNRIFPHFTSSIEDSALLMHYEDDIDFQAALSRGEAVIRHSFSSLATPPLAEFVLSSGVKKLLRQQNKQNALSDSPVVVYSGLRAGHQITPIHNDC